MRNAVIASALFLSMMGTATAEIQTIVSHEEEKFFYAGVQMRKYEGQYEYTYSLDVPKNTLTRIRIYDYQTQKIKADETVYQIMNTLDSDPINAPRFSLPPLIRAVGKPDTDTVELLVIRPDMIISTVSTPTELVVSRCKRLK